MSSPLPETRAGQDVGIDPGVRVEHSPGHGPDARSEGHPLGPDAGRPVVDRVDDHRMDPRVDDRGDDVPADESVEGDRVDDGRPDTDLTDPPPPPPTAGIAGGDAAAGYLPAHDAPVRGDVSVGDVASTGPVSALAAAPAPAGSPTDPAWLELQSRFVDDPRAAVDGAADLIERTLADLRARLTASDSTEDLRTAFRTLRDLHRSLP